MTRNDPTAAIHMQIMWNRLIAVVEEQAQTLIHTAFSTAVREAGDLSAGVFDPAGPHDRPGGHRHAGPCQFDGAVGRALPQEVSGGNDEAGRCLSDQRSLAQHRPSLRFHRRDAGLQEGPAGGAVRLDRACRRYRRHRLRRRRTLGVRGRAVHSDHAAGRGRRPQQAPVRHRRGQRARADPGEGRPAFARRLQRDRLPSAGRDDGRVLARDARGDRAVRHRQFARGDAGRDRQAAQGHLASQHDGRRLRGADRDQGGADDLRIGHPCRLHRHLAALGLRHQRAVLLHRCLHRVRRALHRGAGDPEQCRLARHRDGERAGRLDPACAAAKRRDGAPRGGPDAARRDVRLPAPGDGRRHAGRGCSQPVGHAAVRRTGHRARHAASHRHHALHGDGHHGRRHRRAAAARTACRPPPSPAACAASRSRSPRRSRRS